MGEVKGDARQGGGPEGVDVHPTSPLTSERWGCEGMGSSRLRFINQFRLRIIVKAE